MRSAKLNKAEVGQGGNVVRRLTVLLCDGPPQLGGAVRRRQEIARLHSGGKEVWRSLKTDGNKLIKP
jgi:hypothetical protein